MPHNIPTHRIEQAGNNLRMGSQVVLTQGVRIKIEGTKLTIEENGDTVFRMTTQVLDGELIVDSPYTFPGQTGRGWALLGVWIALNFGIAREAQSVKLGTLIEPTSEAYSLWNRVGIISTVPSVLLFAHERTVAEAQRVCIHGDNFVVRDV